MWNWKKKCLLKLINRYTKLNKNLFNLYHYQLKSKKMIEIYKLNNNVKISHKVYCHVIDQILLMFLVESKVINYLKLQFIYDLHNNKL